MLQPIETHYDILNVTRTAPLEVIKASYRVLSQKYHPDRNPDPEALRRMKLINQAWDVLSDPERRATHDRWITTQESISAPYTPSPPSPSREGWPRSTAEPAPPPAPPPGGWERKHTLILLTAAAAVTLMMLALWQLMNATRIDDASLCDPATRLAAAPAMRAGQHAIAPDRTG